MQGMLFWLRQIFDGLRQQADWVGGYFELQLVLLGGYAEGAGG